MSGWSARTARRWTRTTASSTGSSSTTWGATSRSSRPRPPSVRTRPSRSRFAPARRACSRSPSSTPTRAGSRGRRRSRSRERRPCLVRGGHLGAGRGRGHPLGARPDRRRGRAGARAGQGQGDPEPPPFSLLRLDGRRVALSDFTGHVVLLYFWTTASPYGAAELTSTIDKVQRERRERQFTVVAVNVKEKKEEVAPWVEKRGLSPVVLLDTDGGVSADYRVRALPTGYVSGRDMTLVGRVAGTRACDDGAEKALLDYPTKAMAR